MVLILPFHVLISVGQFLSFVGTTPPNPRLVGKWQRGTPCYSAAVIRQRSGKGQPGDRVCGPGKQ